MAKTARLKTLSDVRRFLARVTNDLNGEKIDENRARCFGYLASVMKDLIRESDIEEMVKKLETALLNGGAQ